MPQGMPQFAEVVAGTVDDVGVAAAPPICAVLAAPWYELYVDTWVTRSVSTHVVV